MGLMIDGKGRNHRLVIIGLLYYSLFWVLSLFVERELIFEIANAALVAACVGAFVAWLPGIWETLTRHYRLLDGGHFLIVGIVGAGIGTGWEHIWRWIWRFIGRPDWMLDSLFLAFPIWVGAGAFGLFLLSTNVVEGRIPKKNWARLGVFCMIAVALTIAAVWGLSDDDFGSYGTHPLY